MARSLREKLSGLPQARRERIEARAAELIAEEMSLRDLRRAFGRTQADVAAELGVGQDTVSRHERCADMLLSTLQKYLDKVGASLVLVAEFPDRNPVRLSGFGDIAPPSRQRAERPRRRHATA